MIWIPRHPVKPNVRIGVKNPKHLLTVRLFFWFLSHGTSPAMTGGFWMSIGNSRLDFQGVFVARAQNSDDDVRKRKRYLKALNKSSCYRLPHEIQRWKQNPWTFHESSWLIQVQKNHVIPMYFTDLRIEYIGVTTWSLPKPFIQFLVHPTERMWERTFPYLLRE